MKAVHKLVQYVKLTIIPQITGDDSNKHMKATVKLSLYSTNPIKRKRERKRQIGRIDEGRFKEEIKGCSERDIIFRVGGGGGEHNFVIRFPGYARSSLW
jgi:hypothetical protein